MILREYYGKPKTLVSASEQSWVFHIRYSLQLQRHFSDISATFQLPNETAPISQQAACPYNTKSNQIHCGHAAAWLTGPTLHPSQMQIPSFNQAVHQKDDSISGMNSLTVIILPSILFDHDQQRHKEGHLGQVR